MIGKDPSGVAVRREGRGSRYFTPPGNIYSHLETKYGEIVVDRYNSRIIRLLGRLSWRMFKTRHTRKDPMLSKEQANIIADGLLDNARAARPRFHRAAGMPVHWLYRCRALRSVPEALQAEVVRQAKKETVFNPWFAILVVICIAAPWVSWTVRAAVFGKSGFGIPILALLPPMLSIVQILLVRRAIDMIATQLGAGLATAP
jgi:hypothetical protein